MTERILDFSERPARLNVRNGLLVIDLSDRGTRPARDATTARMAVPRRHTAPSIGRTRASKPSRWRILPC